MNQTPQLNQILALAVAFMACVPSVIGESFYKEPPLFSQAPDEKKSVSTIGRFGPVGMAVELHQPAFTMIVGKIEDGSPAASSTLKAGQIIESINGGKLKDIDPRIQLGRIIENAEAADGTLKFLVKDMPDAAAKEIVVKIPALGAYSKTWPLDCPKSDKIVRNFAEYLKKPGSNQGFAEIGMLFLLSTGDDSDLAVVRDWARGQKGDGGTPWNIGYGGLALCEYYLRTGDKEVLPAIQARATKAIEMETFGGWAGRGPLAAVTYGGGGGHLNAGGTLVVAYLMLAKECGAEIPDEPLQRILAHFYRFVGKGNNPYGNNKPESGYTDNGKNGALAFAMAAAASLTPDGGKSIYAKARDTNARFSFYSTSYMLHGHTGGGIGEIWRSAAMGLLHEKLPNHYRDFMDQRKWHYELSRRFDGSFGILGGERYDEPQWGAGYALSYTVPRKTLRLTGAPPSKFSKLYQLPERPWGTKADDDFVNTEPPALADGTKLDFSKETLANDASMAMNQKLGGGNVDAATTRRYLRHPDYMIRSLASRSLKNLEPAVLAESLTSTDARVRRAALEGILGDTETKLLTQENFARVIAMLKDPQESWFVKDAALGVVSRAPADWIVAQVDVILPFLKHEEWWLQNSALTALTPVVADKRCYQKVLPAIGELIRTNPLYNVTSPVRWGKLPENLASAPPEVQAFAGKEFKQAYTNYVPMETRSIPPLAAANDKNREFLASTLAGIEGGYDLLYQVARERDPANPLPYQEIFLNADPRKFGPELRKAILPIIRDKLIYQYIGLNRRTIFSDLETKKQGGSVTNSIDGLVALYQKAGVNDYDWKSFGPDLKNAQWSYFTYDPKEEQQHDLTPWRYRAVTYPAGMENWFARDFDPAKAGWKKGRFPIGQFSGKLTDSGTRNPWNETPRTLWEKEVLLVSGSFELPALKPGHSYRLRVQTGQGVGAGDGFKVYINGKPLVETKVGLGRREGDTIRGGWITPEFAGELSKAPVTIAATSFLRYGDRAIVTMPPVPQGIFSKWLEERKLPPLDSAVIQKAATFVPMVSSEWQTQNDPASDKQATDEDKYTYDGKFIANAEVIGAWKTVGLVNTIEEFTPDKKTDFSRSAIKQISIIGQGTTDSPDWIWSGDTLMDLERNQALKMVAKTIGGTDYLFIEAGGFSIKNKPDWKTQWSVMKGNAK